MRVVIADDEVLLKEGLAHLLVSLGLDVVGKAGTLDELLQAVERTRPDVAIVDIRMPPTHTDEGLVAARKMKASQPQLGVLVLSHYLDSRYAQQLLEDHPNGVGYLLKERVSDVAVVLDALHRVDEGECVLDPTIVARLVNRPRPGGPLTELSDREREVLALMAEGRSNGGIRDKLVLSPRTVEAHVKHIFAKLGLGESHDDHRRVLAVLTYLRSR